MESLISQHEKALKFEAVDGLHVRHVAAMLRILGAKQSVST